MQRYFALEKCNDKFILDCKDVHHIVNVMRMVNGSHIEVVYDDVLYECIVKIANDFEVVLDRILIQYNDMFFDIVLIVPVLKEQKMDLILQKATELGVNRIIPIVTERCVVKISDNGVKKIDRWQRIVKEASEQSKRITVPIVDKIHKIDDLIFDDGVKLVCSTVEKSKNLKNVMQSVKKYGRMYIVAGPEGGLTTTEEMKLNSNGFVSITLGNRILRVETVPLFVLSCLNYELME